MTIPFHRGEDLGKGLRGAIQRDLAPAWERGGCHEAFVAVIVREEDGYWFVGFPGVLGCHTQGRTLRAARERMRDALGLYVEDADAAQIVEDLRLPDDALGAVRRSAELRAQATEVQQESQVATRDAVRSPLGAGLTLRDAGDVLGLSYQRVHQLAG